MTTATESVHTVSILPALPSQQADYIRKTDILARHDIAWRLGIDGRLYAADEYVDRNRLPHLDWKDISEFTTRQLYDWLGY